MTPVDIEFSELSITALNSYSVRESLYNEGLEGFMFLVRLPGLQQ